MEGETHMSTKIYNAYKIDGEYSLVQLNNMLEDVRTQFRKYCELVIANVAVKEFLYSYYIVQLHGKDCLALAFEHDTLTTRNILNSILNGDLKTAWLNIYYKFIAEINQNSSPNSHLNFRYNLQIFPLENKILAMYFGPPDLQVLIENNPLFHEYSYDNYRPGSISDEEWKIRGFDWEKAIGPDYIPSNHGWNIQLFNPKDILPIFNPNKIETIVFPDDNTMIQRLCETFEEDTDIVKTTKIIDKKINFIHDKKIFCNLLGFNTKKHKISKK